MYWNDKLELNLRSMLFTFAMLVSTFVIGPLTLLAYPFGLAVRYRVAQKWVQFNLWALRKICHLDYEVRGLENIPPGNGVILCKHQSTWETIGLQAIFPSVCFILKKELLRLPIWGWAMATLEPIAIDRQAKSAAMKQILREGERRLRKGRWLVIFPEGTRVAPGQKGRYGASGGILANRSGYPVLPIAHNAGEYWARGGLLKRPGTISVRIGPLIDSSRLPASEVNQRAEQWIESQMAEITHVSRASDHPPKAVEEPQSV
jgi:1-acyl-sn-glycerol-3-phosphate acyltransferase